MLNDALPAEWAILRDWLPEDLDGLAREHDFIQRSRGLEDSERWLRLILMHVAGGLSLGQAAVRARELGLADVSGVALFKRLRKAEPWLQELCRHLLQEQQRRLGACTWPERYRVRVIDATDIREPGRTGSTWRVHYAIRLPELVCDHYELTDDSQGEKLGRFRFAPGDLVLVDRGYSHRAGAALVLESKAALLLRWSPASFPVEAITGKPFDLLRQVRRLKVRGAAEWPIQFRHDGRVHRLRLCAVRKNRVAAEHAERKALRKARCNGHTPDPEFLELTAYTLILTSLPTSVRTAEVLELYRCRWQIELAFKRLKSLLGTGHVPKSDDRSSRAWMQAKLLTALLLERLLLEAKVFSPWGFQLRDLEPVALGD